MQRETGRDLGKISIGRPADPGRLSASQDSPPSDQSINDAGRPMALRQHVCPSIVIVLVLRVAGTEGLLCKIHVEHKRDGKGIRSQRDEIEAMIDR